MIINPVAHAGQLEGGFAFGIGAALMEELVVEEGVVVGRSLGETKLPTHPRRAAAAHRAGSARPGPARSAPRAPASCPTRQIAPAIANAVADAIGVRIPDLPLTPERVLAALRSRGTAAG